jgi:hypothetical protein
MKKPKKAKIGVEERHRLFVKAYIAYGFHGINAYRHVYPKASYSTARVNSSDLLIKTDIRAMLEEEMKAFWKEKDSEMAKGETFKLIHAVGQSQLSDVVDIKNGTFEVKDEADMSPEALIALQSIEKIREDTKYGVRERVIVKMNPKLPALEMRAKIQGMLKDDQDNGTLNIIIHKAVRPEHTPPRRKLPVEGEENKDDK